MVGLAGDGHMTGDPAGMMIGSAAMMCIARANPQMPTLAAAAMSAVLAPFACLQFSPRPRVWTDR